MRKKSLIVCFLCLLVSALYGQTYVHSYTEQVRTLRVVRACDMDDAGQLRAVRPFLVLQDGMVDGTEPENTLHISFDEMSHDVHQYTYTVTHWKADRTAESGLSSVEYLKGFTTQDITDYEHSINTTQEYTHYRFFFPNENMSLTCSGNYVLTIYEDGDPSKRVADVHFCVVEPLTPVAANVRSNTDIELSGRYQQVDFDLSTAAIRLNDPNEIRVLVKQNNRSDNAVWLNRPTFVEPNRLRYQNQKSLIFEGGNEYHHFDAFSTYYAGTGVDRIFFQNGNYQAPLFIDEVSQGQYIHQFDSDGKFIVNAERTSNSDVEAEYMWVHWALYTEQPWFDGAVYVGGDLFNNELQLTNRMQYNADEHIYWLTAFVKQGGYDYQYWKAKKGSNMVTTETTDGSYWQTENEYAIYVYWRPFGARYDRLVGLQIQKSAL